MCLGKEHTEAGNEKTDLIHQGSKILGKSFRDLMGGKIASLGLRWTLVNRNWAQEGSPVAFLTLTACLQANTFCL